MTTLWQSLNHLSQEKRSIHNTQAGAISIFHGFVSQHQQCEDLIVSLCRLYKNMHGDGAQFLQRSMNI